MSTIQSCYDQLVHEGILTRDQAQYAAISALDALLHQINNNQGAKGIYLYGPVGRGKSYLMDLFFESIHSEKKQRLHFHHFMSQIHQQLRAIQGEKNPLQKLAVQWAKSTKVLCFDEFFVKDIGDAMILSGLLEAFVKSGIIFVTTSNSHPNELYKNGLQRCRFEPTISLILEQCEIINICGKFDHRFRHGFVSNYYIVNDRAKFLTLFSSVLGTLKTSKVEILGRPISIEGTSESSILADFMALCSSPRATADYMELANQYDAIFVGSVMQMGTSAAANNNVQGIEEGYIRSKHSYTPRTLDDEARRFIALVDEFYDRKKLVIVSADVELQSLYIGEQLAFEFERTKSRLVEMQSWPLPQ
ncbi:cell division protein ZapE [Pseudoalteromonas luteoviolacea]|uniref:cell division protein ZapE n=1 Tax=Pseudoalteromonas luteoviolacea TaxID=43657 RepID=UPI0011539EF3|nr:cell division protein ZapE [Pseudoalteromonas luteoviolacea]TQF67452.1 AFG1 family ATPase [Pseudoalteromonas luteoviolacea]